MKYFSLLLIRFFRWDLFLLLQIRFFRWDLFLLLQILVLILILPCPLIVFVNILHFFQTLVDFFVDMDHQYLFEIINVKVLEPIISLKHRVRCPKLLFFQVDLLRFRVIPQPILPSRFGLRQFFFKWFKINNGYSKTFFECKACKVLLVRFAGRARIFSLNTPSFFDQAVFYSVQSLLILLFSYYFVLRHDFVLQCPNLFSFFMVTELTETHLDQIGHGI